MTFDNTTPPDFVLAEHRIWEQAKRHGFELVDPETRVGDRWWRWQNRGTLAGWFRTRREAAYWMHEWLARYGYAQNSDR